MKNVADTLRTRPRRWPWIGGGVVAAGVIVAAVVVGPSFAANPSPAPTPTLTPYVATLTPAELDSVQQGADLQAATIAADKAAADAAAAKALADAAAPSADQGPGYAVGQAPAGTPIPMHLDNDPNSGSYGQMVIEDPGYFCASKSGSTVNGVPVCD